MSDARDAGETDLREAALRFSVDISGDEESVDDIVGRAQIFYDWMAGVFAVPVKYEFDNPATVDFGVENVVPIKPRRGK